jgi:C1A family cysteine protease
MTDDGGATPDEGPRTRRVQRYGWIPDLPDVRDHLYAAPQRVLDKLPGSVDLRAGCPPVYDQGQLGSCTANAIGAAFAYAQKKQGLADFMPSRLFVYWNERKMEGTVDEDSGAMIRDGIKSVHTQGVCSETTWPYVIERFTRKPSKAAYTEAAKHQVTAYRRIRQQLNQMQGCLASGVPFVFGFSVYESFESDKVASTGYVPLPRRTEALVGGHAVLAVGYRDQTQRFIVRNSWGRGWGMHGYCTMPYAYLTDASLASDFWAVDTVEKPG